MLNDKLNAQQEFHPRHCGSPQMRYHPNRYYITIPSAQGRFEGGQALVPSVIDTVLWNS